MYDKRGPAMLSVRLPEDIEKRLEALAKATGRSKTYYVREALIQKLEDMEDVYLAEAVLERIRSGEERVISAEEFWRGMDD
jgi:RHH-type rel operon transcriptional repressor/antitoxin RelB